MLPCINVLFFFLTVKKIQGNFKIGNLACRMQLKMVLKILFSLEPYKENVFPRFSGPRKMYKIYG